MKYNKKERLSNSCLDGYLTQGCRFCAFWYGDERKESEKRLRRALTKLYGHEPGIGCNACFPIGDCPFFQAMERHIDLTVDN